ncbi:MAG: hypothetical protein NTX15_02255 [Candidatus Kapabacteria bacterium]|nr:hypothetical protein [Candidatus Kapabacteria bacterium]
MSFQKTIAVLLLSTFLLVVGASAVHTHSSAVDALDTVETSVGHSHAGGCSFCHVVKERVAVVDTIEEYTTLCVVERHDQVVVRMISDRCPLETAGRAPPLG